MDGAWAGGVIERWVRPAMAVALLNVSLTFVSIWPTLAITPSARLSLETAVLLLGLVLAAGWRPQRLGRTAERVLASLWVLLIVVRYVEVTTRSLYGREVNLFWDLQLLPDVGAMFAYVAQPRILLAFVGALLAVPLLLFLPIRWAMAVVNRACAFRPFRLASLAAALGLLLLAFTQRLDGGFPRPPVAAPVTPLIAGEVIEFVREATRGDRRVVPQAPAIDSDLANVQGADVLLLFVESYGATSWERPEFAATLAPARDRLAAAIAGSGRAVVSGTVESTTFGGESWLAHISLLSGTEVRDADLNRRLMRQQRDTMVTAFSRRGYRTLAIMPGLHAPWPEGSFYGFDRIYGAPDLAYEGPPFGWWDVTDQFVLARLDDLALAPRARPPVFVFLPTISTHAPFTPVPPYQPDWTRLLTPTPYDEDDLERAYEAEPDWSNLGPGYARALGYLYETLSGYLQRHADRDLVLIVIGDHQPPALVSGEGASWNVPVHVVGSRRTVLERLRAQGFREGLTPPAAELARMDTLMPILLHAFGNHE